MEMNLLKSKMALKGDFNTICLVSITGLSKAALYDRINGNQSWKQDEIKKIKEYYELSNDDVVDIFDLG